MASASPQTLADSTNVADSNGDAHDVCPYCGGDWQPPRAAAERGRWVVVHCTECDAT